MVQGTIDCSEQVIKKLFDNIMDQNQLSVLNQITSRESSEKGNIICAQRDRAVSTIRCLTHFYTCTSVTFATAVSSLDRFLSKVKVQPKYYSCVATACFYLSIKFLDEDETATLALALIHHSLKESSLMNDAVRQCVLDLHNICQVSDAEFYECQAAVGQVLDNYKNSPKTHPRCLPTPKPFLRPNLVSRPSLYGDSELPAIEENPSLEVVVSESERRDEITTTRFDSRTLQLTNQHSTGVRPILAKYHFLQIEKDKTKATMAGHKYKVMDTTDCRLNSAQCERIDNYCICHCYPGYSIINGSCLKETDFVVYF
uniref:Cyclin-G1 n=1 Tax=Magallana gigas TaxID=29159 RepID=K1QAQ5_MAGGI